MEKRQMLCWEISQCSEHRRRNCPAYRLARNCWEVNGTPINSDNHVECESCPVILSRIARAIAEAISQTQRVAGK